MGKAYLSILVIFLFITSLSGVLGLGDWFNDGNAGRRGTGGTGNILFSSNIPNAVENESYSECEIFRSHDNPSLIIDYNDDGVDNIISVSGTSLYVYDPECSIVEVYDTGYTQASTLSSSNIDENDYQEIVYMNSTHLNFYQYDDSIGAIIKNNNLTFDFSSEVSNGGAFACAGDDDGTGAKCMIMGRFNNEAATYNFNTSTLTGFTSNNAAGTRTFHQTMGGGYYYDTILGKQYFMFIGQDSSTSEPEGNVYEPDGTSVFNELISGSGSGGPLSDYGTHFYAAKVGNSFYWFSSAYYLTDSGTTTVEELNMYSNTGSELYTTSRLTYSGPDIRRYGNFMVADYDKDGVNDICHLNSTASGDARMLCLDQTGSQTLNLNTPDYNITGSVMADFNYSDSTMKIFTRDGFFDDTTQYERNTTTTISYARNYPEVISFGASNTPLAVFQDGVSMYIIVNTLVSTSCGNGVCDDFENAFSCPADCSAVSPTPTPECRVNTECPSGEVCLSGACTPADEAVCEDDDDCPDDRPNCFFNECVLIGNNECLSAADCPTYAPRCIYSYCTALCVYDSDCPFEQPICFNSFCVAKTASEVDAGTGQGGSTAPEDSINNAIDILFSGNQYLRYIIGFILMIVAGFFIFSYLPNNPFGQVFMVVIVSIVLTVLKFLPVAIVILMIIIGVILIIMMKMLSPGGGGGGG